MAEMADHHAGLVWDSSTSHGHARTLLRSAAAALLTAAEERETRARVAADREQQLTEVAERWRRLEAERTAELRAAAARGAERERGVGEMRRAVECALVSLKHTPGEMTTAGIRHATELLAAALSLAPRPSAGPAAPDVTCGDAIVRGDAVWCPVHDCAQEHDGHGWFCPKGDRPAARASDDPAPTTPDKMNCPEARKPGGCQLHNLHCRAPECFAAAPAAPEVPRG